ncbi:MAG: D-glycerate dehydrogenase [Candidatus Helarchaeota archaeon]|nr:D-glycerate dehydrogenase [Candidatus Helarchaeota archaeon]
MLKIFITREILSEGIDLIRNELPNAEIKIQPEEEILTKEKLKREIVDIDGLLCSLSDIIDEEIISAAKNLKVISNYAVGFDNINIKFATKKKIMVTNTPGVLTEATADIAWGLIFAAARRLIEADKYLRDGKWKRWAPSLLLGYDLYGKTLGIIGMGRIGSAVAKRAVGFNMHIIYYSRTKKPEIEKKLKAKFVDLTTLLKEADIVSIHVPLTNKTKEMIGKKEFNLMKKTSILINTSRGAVIDEQALIEVLKEKKIAAAGLDVFTHEPIDDKNPLVKLENVVLLPHLGSATYETRTKMALIAAKNLVMALKGEMPPNLV